MSTGRLPDSFFDGMYDDSPDPWGFQSLWYEKRKLALTAAMLQQPTYAAAFEPGCSMGLVTELLADRCERVIATDVSAAVLDAARTRLAGRDNVEVRRWALGDPWPEEQFDLIVLSEVAYYLELPLLREVMTGAQQALEPGGTLLAVHWRYRVREYPTTGDQVHEVLESLPELSRTARYRDEDVVLETFQKVPPEPVSVAAREGLVPEC